MAGIKIWVILQWNLRMESNFSNTFLSIIYRSQGADGKKKGELGERCATPWNSTRKLICLFVFPRRIFRWHKSLNPPLHHSLPPSDGIAFSFPQKSCSRGKRDVRKNEVQRGVRIHRCEKRILDFADFLLTHSAWFYFLFSLCFSCLWIFRISYCVWSLSWRIHLHLSWEEERWGSRKGYANEWDYWGECERLSRWDFLSFLQFWSLRLIFLLWWIQVILEERVFDCFQFRFPCQTLGSSQSPLKLIHAHITDNW